MQRRDFLKVLGFAGFVGAVHNVPRVLAKPKYVYDLSQTHLDTVRQENHPLEFSLQEQRKIVGNVVITQNGAHVYEGPCEFVEPGKTMRMDGQVIHTAKFENPVQCKAGDTLKVQYTLREAVTKKPSKHTVAEAWALAALAILENNLPAARVAFQDIGESAHKAGVNIGKFGRALECKDVIS